MTEDSKKPISIGAEKAIALAESGFWVGMSYRERAELQFSIREICMPFDVLHEAVQKTLGRPVWSHEFIFNWKGLAAEVRGDAPTPSFEEIMGLIPDEKLILVGLGVDAAHV